MDLASILALVEGVSSILTVINNAKAALSASDQATVDAALATATSQEAADEAQAITDLNAAAQTQ
jgi:hypothetical protein